uniref:Uncharacterized protein n=1 Tax=Bosea sp. NBC_00436 TaxID=2969620 RepID=A0A9E8CPA4_9HYPH
MISRLKGDNYGTLRPSYVAGGQPLGTSSNGFKVPELSQLLADGVIEMDLTKRRAIYRKADQLALDNTTFVGLCYRATGFGLSNSLQGFEMLPSVLSPFSNLDPGKYYRK